MNSETLINNLFRIAQSINTPITPFKIISRRWRHFKDVAPEEVPCLFQFQSPSRKMIGGVRPLLKQELRLLWCAYLPMSQTLSDVVSPALNNYCDVLVNALQTTMVSASGAATPNGRLAGTIQDLGFPGKVHCYADGDALTDEGLLSTYSLLVVPITILVGM